LLDSINQVSKLDTLKLNSNTNRTKKRVLGDISNQPDRRRRGEPLKSRIQYSTQNKENVTPNREYTIIHHHENNNDCILSIFI